MLIRMLQARAMKQARLVGRVAVGGVAVRLALAPLRQEFKRQMARF
jgi:hypothetical protein